MTKNKKEIIIISLGGSIIVPDKIDFKFLKKFKELILKFINEGYKFVIVTGGGKTCRNYQGAAREVGVLNLEDLDWIGIHASRLNAHLVRTIFRKESHSKINTNPEETEPFKESILVAAGWKPGWSTDYDAALLAKAYGAKRVINLSNIDYVYDKDPKKFKDAKPLKEVDWNTFINLMGTKWGPGSNLPFDPMASRLGKKLGLEVVVLKGTKLKNFKKYLKGEKFKGTVIS